MSTFESMTEQERRIANRKAAWRWGSLIVGLLSLQVAGGIAAIILATGDESVAVVPDYYQRALQWDDTMALRRQSESLGWDLQFNPLAGHAQTDLQVILSDTEGVPVEVREGLIEWYHHARANQVRRTTLPGGQLMSIVLPDCLDRPGLWQVSIDVTDIHGNRFVDSQSVTVERDSGAVSNAVSVQ